MYGECAWMASIMLFRIMVRDVDPIIYLRQTTEKDKVLLPPPPRNNRTERNCYVHSIESSSATCKCCAHDIATVNGSDFVILSFFFCRFQPKATRAGDEKHIVRRPKWGKGSKTESCWYRRVNEQFLQKWLRKCKRNLVAKKARTYEWVIVTYGRFLVDRRAPRVTKATCTFWSQPKARETL